MRLIVFSSEQFRPYLPDDCQVNPNTLGFELAHWLSRELAAEGVVTSYPLGEDWGWFLERLEGDDDEHMICCSGDAGSEGHEWRIFVTKPKRLFRRPSQDDRCDQILDLVKNLIEAAGIPVSVETE